MLMLWIKEYIETVGLRNFSLMHLLAIEYMIIIFSLTLDKRLYGKLKYASEGTKSSTSSTTVKHFNHSSYTPPWLIELLLYNYLSA